MSNFSSSFIPIIVSLAGKIAAALLVMCPLSVMGQAYPTKPVRVVVPVPPGGGTDLIARLVTSKMAELWQQQTVVDNQSGAGGTIGTHNVARSAPDGYTLLIISLNIAYAPALYRDLPYNVERDLVAIAPLATQPSMLAVHPSLPVRTVSQLIALARARPGEIRYSSGGSGSATHLPIELFRSAANIRLTHVPYKGGGPAALAVMTGEVQMTIATVTTLLPHVNAGKLRALAVTGARRSKAAPELPSVADSGLPGYQYEVWYGVFGPARIPAGIVGKLNEDFHRAIASPDIQNRFSGLGIEPSVGTPQQFAAYVGAEIKKWAKVVSEAGIRIE